MNAPLFNSNINWNRLWIVVATVTIVWTGLSTIVPEPYYRVTATILSAVQAGFTFALRSGRYVKDRGVIPGQGENP